MCDECVKLGKMTQQELDRLYEIDDLLKPVIDKAKEYNIGPEYIIPRLMELAGGSVRIVDATNLDEEITKPNEPPKVH